MAIDFPTYIGPSRALEDYLGSKYFTQVEWEVSLVFSTAFPTSQEQSTGGKKHQLTDGA